MVCGSARTRRSAAWMPARLEHTDATHGSASAAVSSSDATSAAARQRWRLSARVQGILCC